MRAFLKHLATLQLLNWLIKPIWIFYIERGIQNAIGTQLYGEYFVALNLCLLFSLLLDFGINNYVTTQIASKPETLSSLLIPVLFLRLVFAVVFAAVVSVSAIFNGIAFQLIFWVIINQILSAFLLYFRAMLQGLQQFNKDAWLSVIDRLVAVIFCGIALESVKSPASLAMWFVHSQTLGYATAVIVAVWLVNPTKGLLRFPNKKLIKTVVSSSIWFALLAFSMGLFTRIDVIMLRNLAPNGFTDAGIYAQSFRLLDAALIFSSLISTQLLPLFTALLAKKESTQPLAWLSTRIILLVSIPTACLALFYAQPIMKLLYQFKDPAELKYSSTTFALILSSFVPMALVHVFGTLLTASSNLKWLVTLSLGCAILNIMGNLIFIPHFAAAGAAVSCLLTQTVFASACYLKSKKLFSPQIININGNPYSAEKFFNAKTLTWVVGAFPIFYIPSQLIPNPWYAMLGAFFLFIVYTYFLGIFKSELAKVWK